MKIKDILQITGGNTKIIIFGIFNEQYQTLWEGIVDDINFNHIPYGNQEICHMSVINREDNLILQFDYPKLLLKQIKDKIEKFAIGFPYPIEWIELLYIKYSDFKYIKEMLVNLDKNEIYNEIKMID